LYPLESDALAVALHRVAWLLHQSAVLAILSGHPALLFQSVMLRTSYLMCKFSCDNIVL